MRNEETAKLTSAAGTSEVLEAARYTVGVSEIAEAAVVLLLVKGGLLLSGAGLEVAVAIAIIEKYPVSLHTYGWYTECS